MSTTNRLSSTKEEIHRLIQDADNARDKAYLLLMLDIHDTLIENTKVTKLINGKVDTHIVSYNADIQESVKSVSRSRGIWQATSFFLVILQSIFAYGYVRMVNENDDQNKQLAALEVHIAAHDVTIDELRHAITLDAGSIHR